MVHVEAGSAQSFLPVTVSLNEGVLGLTHWVIRIEIKFSLKFHANMVDGVVKRSIVSEQSTKHGRHESVSKLKLKHLEYPLVADCSEAAWPQVPPQEGSTLFRDFQRGYSAKRFWLSKYIQHFELL